MSDKIFANFMRYLDLNDMAIKILRVSLDLYY